MKGTGRDLQKPNDSMVRPVGIEPTTLSLEVSTNADTTESD